MSDRDILAIPDSLAWDAGVHHERERNLRIIQQLLEQSPLDSRFSRNSRLGFDLALQRAADAIREAP
ncbi:hypothetical protein LBMAG41_10690 [Cyanobium sp.]|nr:hypothetical protein LBMAG41_10690 [Cyanobium sp.]